MEQNEQKRSSISKDDDGIATYPSTKGKTKSGPNSIPYQSVPSSNINDNNHNDNNSISTKIYLIAGYRILLHLLLLYCIIGVTYLLLAKSTDCQCSQVKTADLPPTMPPTHTPSDNPTFLPSQYPTTNIPIDTPSANPTKTPSMSRTTLMPTDKPTLMPSRSYDGYRNYVGDYKLSAKNQSHGYWKLCDGSFLDSRDYPELFNVIGHSFGALPEFASLFALPTMDDQVIGVVGDKYGIGSHIGKENTILTEEHIPSHSHNVAQHGICSGEYSTSQPYLSRYCTRTNNWDNYNFGTTSIEPNAYLTSSYGKGQSFDIIQPTVFVGNLFIFADG